MKDVGSLITLRVVANTSVMEVSVLDSFQCSAMYTHLPVKKDLQASAWVNIVNDELNALSNALKTHTNALILLMTNNDHIEVFDGCSKQPIDVFLDAKKLKPIFQFKSHASRPMPIEPIEIDNYHLVTFISLDLLGIFLNLSVGSAVITLCLKSNGQLTISNKHEYGTTLIEKQLTGFENLENKDGERAEIICKARYIIKFIKQIVNHLVNCSKHQCLLGIPKQKNAPLAIQFLLASGIYQTVLLLHFRTPLHHSIIPNSTQNPLQFDLEESEL